MNENIYTNEIAENNPITINGILERIDKVLDDKKYIDEAFNLLKSEPQPHDDTAVAIYSIVKAREDTNRKILEILETQLNRLTKNDNSMNRLKELVGILREGEQDDKTGNYAKSSMEIVKDVAMKMFYAE